LIKPIEYTMTMAASAASGSSAMTGAMSSIVNSVAAAVTNADI
jgi:hypothetical protein